jgi:hypothetical protein
MRIHFCTFGSRGWERSMARIKREAIESGYFTDIHAYDETNLPGLEDHAEFIEKNPRGYGYWIWKPLVILDVMKKCGEGDIIVYADTGSTISSGKEKFQQLIQNVLTHPTHRLAYTSEYIEGSWTKRDVFDFFGSTDFMQKQLGGSPQFIMNTSENEYIMQDWLRVMCIDSYHLVDDSPPLGKNYEPFGEHRHDQSILSFVYRKYGFCTCSYDMERDPILPSRIKDC